MLSRWEEYLSKVGGYSPEGRLPKEPVKDLFPFNVFFANAPQPLFKVSLPDIFILITPGPDLHPKMQDPDLHYSKYGRSGSASFQMFKIRICIIPNMQDPDLHYSKCRMMDPDLQTFQICKFLNCKHSKYARSGSALFQICKIRICTVPDMPDPDSANTALPA